jgi:hypothetical protein
MSTVSPLPQSPFSVHIQFPLLGIITVNGNPRLLFAGFEAPNLKYYTFLCY